jgi:hypothetical protein
MQLHLLTWNEMATTHSDDQKELFLFKNIILFYYPF